SVNAEQLWHAWGTAESPSAARLVGGTIRRRWLVGEETASAHSPVASLSASLRGPESRRPGESDPKPHESPTARVRGASRQLAPCSRSAGRDEEWACGGDFKTAVLAPANTLRLHRQAKPAGSAAVLRFCEPGRAHTATVSDDCSPTGVI